MNLEQRAGDLDPELWFPCVHHPGERDILHPSAGNTFIGRIPAWCETRQVSFRVSLSELPDDVPEATRIWVRGFLAGCVPQWNDDIDDLAEFDERVNELLTTGRWSTD